MLNTCTDNHDDIAYEGHLCPLCYWRADKEAEIAQLQDELKESCEEAEELREQMRNMTER